MKQKILLVIAVLFGVLAFILTYKQIEAEKLKAHGGMSIVNILKLKDDKPAGIPLIEDDLEVVKEKIATRTLSGYVTGNKKYLVIDQKLMIPVQKGEALKWKDLETAGIAGRAKGITKLINPGFRAVSISVDNISSVTNLVKPGDRVDLLGTFRFPEKKGDASLDTVTLTILQYVKILATGTDYGDRSSVSTKRKRSFNSVTLELTPKEAEMIVFASQKGRLTLTLRGPAESAVEENLQRVDFNVLENKLKEYNIERAEKSKSGFGR